MCETHTAGNGAKIPGRIQIICTSQRSNDTRQPGKVLSKGYNKVTVFKEYHKTYRLGIYKMLHMIRWSRPYILNLARECLMMMSCTMVSHIKVMKRIMKYVVTTADGGITLKKMRFGMEEDILYLR